MRSKVVVTSGLVFAASVVLTGCAWGGAASLMALGVLVFALLVGCGGQAIAGDPGGTNDADAGEPDAGEPVDAGPDGTVVPLDGGTESGIPAEAASDSNLPDSDPPDSVSPDCGGGYCPTGMRCVLTGNGPWCLPDADMDEQLDSADNCPYASNSGQADTDGDNVGDKCDLCVGPNDEVSCGTECCNDPDGDLIPGEEVYGGWTPGQDNCPYVPNPDQADADADGVGDACDLCPLDFNPPSPCGDPCLDSDGDGVADMGFCGDGDVDNCAFTPSDHFDDVDGDEVGDVCDPDGIAPLTATSAGMELRQDQRMAARLVILEKLARAGVLDAATMRIASGHVATHV